MRLLSCVLPTPDPSEFKSHFDKKDFMRYMHKLDSLDITVKPQMCFFLFFSTIAAVRENILDLQYLDINNYLVEFPSHYTGECL